ncbi:hypothetical protein HHK36_017216 [Tetracentron sinense]|uniref:Uncharacterized protein n=1 Tax=Tetracentron sinense TaxID=13715 RepID=A0A834YYH9_TETSI|nr:hypothetical protein HHK36_017216 [Tetracentron sinense]
MMLEKAVAVVATIATLVMAAAVEIKVVVEVVKQISGNNLFTGDNLLPVLGDTSPRPSSILEGMTTTIDISTFVIEGKKPTVDTPTSVVEGEKLVAAIPYPDNTDTSAEAEAEFGQKATTMFEETGLSGTFVIDLDLPSEGRPTPEAVLPPPTCTIGDHHHNTRYKAKLKASSKLALTATQGILSEP